MMDQNDFTSADQLAPGMEGLSLYMRQIVRALPKEQGALTAFVVHNAAEQLSGSEAFFAQNGRRLADAQEILTFLAASREGLSLEELNQILEMENAFFPPLLLEQLFCYLYDCFTEEESGRWDFRHRFLRESLLQAVDRTVLDECYRKLFRYYQEKGRLPGEEFYYLWRIGDVSAAADLLQKQNGQQPDTVLRTVFFKMLREAGEGNDNFVKLLYPKLTQAAMETVNRILLSSEGELFAHVWVLRDFYREQTIGKDGTVQQLLLHLLTAMMLEELEAEAYDEAQALWKRIVKVFSGLTALDPCILKTIYEVMFYQSFFGDIVFFERESRETYTKLARMLQEAGLTDEAEDVRRLQRWGELRSRLVQEKDCSKQQKMLEDSEDMVSEWKTSGDPMLYHLALYRIAGSWLKNRKYPTASPLYREIIRWADERWRGVRSLRYGRLCMLAEADLASCLKQEYKSEHYVRVWKTAEELAAQFSSPYTLYYLASICDILYYCDKQKPLEYSWDRIAKWEHVGDYLTQGLDTVRCAEKYMRSMRLPECYLFRKLILLKDRIEWRLQMGSWNTRESIKGEFETVWNGYEEFFHRTNDEYYLNQQLVAAASALEYYGRWRDRDEAVLWKERLIAVTNTMKNSANDSLRYQEFLCHLSAAEAMLRCRNLQEAESLLEMCRSDRDSLLGCSDLEKRQKEWECIQIRMLLLDTEIAQKRKRTASVWMPAAKQACLRSEKLCEDTIRQIEDEKKTDKYVGKSKRNDEILAQFGLWLRAAMLQADGNSELGEEKQADSCLSKVKAAGAFLTEPGGSKRISPEEMGEKGIWLYLEYAKLAVRREKALPYEEEPMPEVLPEDSWERLRELTRDRRTPHLCTALYILVNIGDKHIPDCDLRLWPELYSVTLELMRMYAKDGYDGSQKQRLGILLFRTLWEQAGSRKATDEEKQILAYTLVNSYQDDDKGYDIPLDTYTSKRGDHKKSMKKIQTIPGPFSWPDNFICNTQWHENVYRYECQYGRPADRCLAGMRSAICYGMPGDYKKAYDLCRSAEDEISVGPLAALCRCWKILWKLMKSCSEDYPVDEASRKDWAEASQIREEQRQWIVKENITFHTALDIILHRTALYVQCEISRKKLQMFLENIREKPACYWLEQKYSKPAVIPHLHVLADRLVAMNREEAERQEDSEAFSDSLKQLRSSLIILRFLWRNETEENTKMNEWQRECKVYHCGLQISEVLKKAGDEQASVKERLNSLWWLYDAMVKAKKDGTSADIATEDIKKLLPEYHALYLIRSESDSSEWMDKYGIRTNWIDFNTAVEEMFLFLYEREKDVQWLWLLLAEHKELQRCLLEKFEAGNDWSIEWVTYSYTDIRQAWLKLAGHLPEEEWAKPYLETVIRQAEHIKKNRLLLAPIIRNLLNDLNMELRTVKLESPVLQTELRTLIAEMPNLLSGAGHDLSYIMMKAVEVLGSGATDEQVMKYVQQNLS